jgi:hypothetical protein
MGLGGYRRSTSLSNKSLTADARSRWIGGVRARLVFSRNANNLLFRKPGSIYLSGLMKAGLKLRVEEICSRRSPPPSTRNSSDDAH